MTSFFNVTTLSGHRALVRGTDNHGTNDETILDTAQWDEIKAHFAGDSAMEDFDSAVEDFFAPLMEAKEAYEAAVKAAESDPLAELVVHEPVEPTAGHAGLSYTLTKDSQVLRLIDEGKYDRLLWVKGNLEITTEAVAVAAHAPAPAQGQGAGVVNFNFDDNADQA